MDNLAKPTNRALFLVSVAVTGALAGAAVWLLFFAMEHGIGYLWTEVPHMLGVSSPELASGPFGFLPYPFFVCLLGGLVIGLYEKMTGIKTDDLNQVMAKVKQDGRYPYDNLGKLSLAALLPLLFGGSIGPEAGLTGVIAGLCSWVGDRMRRFGAEFRELTLLGTQAALTALFTAPVFGFVAPLAGSADGQGVGDGEDSESGEITIRLPKAQKTVVYGIAIAGGLGTYLLLGQLMGGGMGMPRFEAAVVGNLELTWLIPLSLIGTICGWLYFVSEHASEALAHAIGARPVVKAMLAGLALAKLCYETLMADGVKAKVALEKGALTPAVEHIIEANTLLSGIGFESSGLAAAHAIHNGLTMLPECHNMYHGEKVAFGTIVQLVLEDAPTEKLEEVLGFCIELGLPVTMKELGVAEVTREQAMIVAEAACAPEDTMCNMPFEVTPEMVANAILGADALGHYYLMDE